MAHEEAALRLALTELREVVLDCWELHAHVLDPGEARRIQEVLHLSAQVLPGQGTEGLAEGPGRSIVIP